MAATEAETVFRSESWLRSEALTDETVLDYFALSPFYDGSPSANLNERARKWHAPVERELSRADARVTWML
jgi:hypothetical protein